jgi:hypothetical protein
MKTTSERIICWYLPPLESFAATSPGTSARSFKYMICVGKIRLCCGPIGWAGSAFAPESALTDCFPDAAALVSRSTVFSRMEAGHAEAANDNRQLTSAGWGSR